MEVLLMGDYITYNEGTFCDLYPWCLSSVGRKAHRIIFLINPLPPPTHRPKLNLSVSSNSSLLFQKHLFSSSGCI